MSELEELFEIWWHDEGAPLIKGSVAREVQFMCHTAWMNGAYVERHKRDEEEV